MAMVALCIRQKRHREINKHSQCGFEHCRGRVWDKPSFAWRCDSCFSRAIPLSPQLQMFRLIITCLTTGDDIGSKTHNENSLMQYTEISKVLKKENYHQKKFCYFFLIIAQNIDSNEYPQSLFWSKNKKNSYTPCKSQFFYIKVGMRWYI